MQKEKKIIAIIGLVFAGLGILLSWVPIVNNFAFVLGTIGLLLGLVALVVNRKNKKVLSLITLLLSVLTLVIVLVTQSIYGNEIKHATKEASSSSKTLKVSSSSTKQNKTKKQSIVEIMNDLAAASKSTDEIYVTGDITIGENSAVKPGIYDMEITGGAGNITGNRKNVNGMFINWLGGAAGNTEGYPSKIRMILMDGDTLNFSNISKVKFTAVPEKVSPSTQVGIGSFVVGRDLPAGNYKLSTNMKLDPQFSNLGWNIAIYNDADGNERSQSYNPGNQDVAVSLKDGEIITTSFTNSNYYETGISDDSAQLIFTAVQ